MHSMIHIFGEEIFPKALWGKVYIKGKIWARTYRKVELSKTKGGKKNSWYEYLSRGRKRQDRFRQVAGTKEWCGNEVKNQGSGHRGTCFILDEVFFLYNGLRLSSLEPLLLKIKSTFIKPHTTSGVHNLPELPVGHAYYKQIALKGFEYNSGMLQSVWRVPCQRG